MFDDWRFQGATQIWDGISFGPTRCDRIREYLPSHLHDASGRFQNSPVLHGAKYRKHFGSGDVGDGPRSKFGEYVLFEPILREVGRVGCPLVLSFFKPFAGNRLKGVGTL